MNTVNFKVTNNLLFLELSGRQWVLILAFFLFLHALFIFFSYIKCDYFKKYLSEFLFDLFLLL